MNRFIRSFLTVAGLLGSAAGVLAQPISLPLEFRQNGTPYNLQSRRGVPISTSTNDYGSDGRAPIPGQDGNPNNPATPNQFRGGIAFGGVVATPANTALNTNLSLAANASLIGLPRGDNGSTALIMLRVQAGAPYLSRGISFLFGAVIPAPETDELGVLLSSVNTNVSPARPVTRPVDYWQAEPHTTNNHAGASYYWSLHAQQVFANQAGPVRVTWRKAVPLVTNNPPANVATDWFQDGNNYYRLQPVQYVVSGSPAKTPRQMYWTERSFRSTGKSVSVPAARVGGIVVAYHSNFPERTTNEFRLPGEVGITDPTNTLQELRTLWYDSQQGQIFAYNREGRVFLEILGDTLGGARRQHLGSEIVEVARQINPTDVTIELGDRLTAYPSAQQGDDSRLFPEPLSSGGNESFAHRHEIAGSDRVEYFATRETQNLNDYQVHWLEEGQAGLRWPFRFVRYRHLWPADVARYSQYLRPPVVTEAEAQQTAVALPTENVPVIEYQDPLDQPRAKLTPDFKFYTFLSPAYPAHRTLLRFNSGENVVFERVFSWLSEGLGTTNFAGSVATKLSSWDTNTLTLNWPIPWTAPRLVHQTVDVGQRINAPLGEPGATVDYLAGHVHLSAGTLFNVNAYRDPFAVGFVEANRGAIIPVNAIPGSDQLEVWWFRKNAADAAHGFKPVFWPSVIGRYALNWPTNSRAIVLASGDGSGPLTSLEAKGTLYFQNDRSQHGYNPNEEHALMQGGQAWALRDDLNIITNGPGYSSEPFVLLDYTASDGRPAMTPFKVLREKPDAGIRFNYQVEAGAILQPPMPLPLLEKPLGPKIIGNEPLSLNQEVYFRTITNSTSDGTLTTVEAHHFRPYFFPLSLQDTAQPSLPTKWLLVTSARYKDHQLSGVISDQKPTRLVRLPGAPPQAVTEQLFQNWVRYSDDGSVTRNYDVVASGIFRYAVTNQLALTNQQRVIVAAPALATHWTTTVAEANAAQGYVDLILTSTQEVERVNQKLLPEEVTQIASNEVSRITLQLAESGLLMVPTELFANNQFRGWRLATEPLKPFNDMKTLTDTNLQQFYAAFTLQDRKANLWVYRGPHDPSDNAHMAMQFYYKTMAGFYFPTLPLAAQPPEGTITPYLRTQESDGSYFGDPVYGNRLDAVRGDANALAIEYRPVWPAFAPTLQMAETLTEPKRGLPAVRGQTSLQLVYQQSQVAAQKLAAKSVLLHDPTREKESELGRPDGTETVPDADGLPGVKLGRIPDSVKTETSRGKTFFPLLPPHLVQRFWFDSNRGTYGALVFKGDFVDDTVGDDYLHLNVLSRTDLAKLRNLCDIADPLRGAWDRALARLATRMELFVEAPTGPGTYVPNQGAALVGPTNRAEVIDDDVAVDSYALTAVGPGTGYVTLVAGNGLAFTPRADPVSVLVVRVSDVLYPGDVKIILPPNPLSELLTLQQVVDLAGKTEDYAFEWKIVAPVDGLPPAVYQNTRRLLLPEGYWNHVPFPLSTDQPGSIHAASAARTVVDVDGTVIAVSRVAFSSVSTNDGKLEFQLPSGQTHSLVMGNAVTVRGELSTNSTLTVIDFPATVTAGTSATKIVADAGRADFRPLELHERIDTNQPQSIVVREFSVPAAVYSQLWLSLDLDPFLGAKVYLDGEPVVTANIAADDTPGLSPPSGFNALRLGRSYRLDPAVLARGGGTNHHVVVEFFSQAQPGTPQPFNLILEAYQAIDQTQLPGTQWLPLATVRYPDGLRAVLGESADIQALTDNYLIMRYRATNDAHSPGSKDWSRWTTPQLAEGWIKRVLAGINPFNQRIADLFNNAVNTDVSLITQAGRRWEGDVALNLESINNYGLIEIYETVLRRGRLLSINAGINYGPANDALLLAAGYLNDLYMMVGNEAWADASNPTIGIGTADRTYGDVATALFAFKGQTASLLEEELGLLRGRDDFLQPGVERGPVYNRLFWNYTRGIDAGEVIYALNYNIQENPNETPNGIINAADAQRMFPQGHGDAYGHYLTALKGYYSLLMDTDFDWVPRIEAVTVLGVPVSVDYQDERKFAAAAAALARTGRQAFDLTWRQDYQSGLGRGWEHLEKTRSNTQRQVPATRYWGSDHWACRTGQGTYLNWIVGNAILPDVDPDPSHEGIQKIDRTTVPELKELASVMEAIQTDLDSTEGGMTPLELPEDSIAFDINPNLVVGGSPVTHFEQVYGRALGALNNAVAAFDDAKDVTRLMRSEQDSLNDVQNQVAQQELAYKHQLIELYGTPYPEDIGPGRTYSTGYDGPDLVHYTYVETPELSAPDFLEPEQDKVFRLDIQNYPANWADSLRKDFNFILQTTNTAYTKDLHFLEFNYGPHGFFDKPEAWNGRRRSPGKVQQAISGLIAAQNHLDEALDKTVDAKTDLDKSIQLFQSKINTHASIRALEGEKLKAQELLEKVKFAFEVWDLIGEHTTKVVELGFEKGAESLPKFFVAGLAAGGDLTAPARAAIKAVGGTISTSRDWLKIIRLSAVSGLELSTVQGGRRIDFDQIASLDWDQELREDVVGLGKALNEAQDQLFTVNHALRDLDDARRHYQALVAQGDRIQEEREIQRQRTSAVVQGFRTRDAAFRIFRNEKLERYKTLFDLAARYSLLAANAYDYETGLLATERGREFVNRIIRARALGVMRNGEPQFAGSNLGDPGLSSALAEMKGDWDVIKGRLGFNNPDAYGTTTSLRTEHLRILPDSSGNQRWKDVLQQARKANLLEDSDVRRYCLQIDPGDGSAVPGIILDFHTEIATGLNLFGQQLGPGDHNFSPSSFATKIYAAGIALEGYRGMDDPAANTGATGGASPADPPAWFLDPDALAATPYIYLIPVGVDSLRSPPLGDASEIRSWNVQDVTIPLPFNIGASQLSSGQFWQSQDFLSEPLFNIRKHQAFRPVSASSVFSFDLYGSNGQLMPSQFTNRRLVGRSVWNSHWKIVIPGNTLLADGNEGLDRFIRTVHDIRLHLVTYSYSGN